MPEPRGGALLAIDFGTRKTGIAVGHALTGSARPLDPIRYTDQGALLEGLANVIRQWRPARIIVGLPLGADGAESDMSRTVREFARELGEAHPAIAIELHDERLTSHAAAGAFAGRREAGRARRRDAQRLDSMAAALILESWMAENG
jgi:putative holliday junction resolvase